MASKKKRSRQLVETLRPQTEFERVVMAFLAVILVMLLFVSIEVASLMVFLLRIIIHGG